VKNERLPPTHVLTIEVPLNMENPPCDYNVVKDAIHVALSISRAAFAGHICGDAEVTLKERE
jgi:hypothetical protein